MKILFLDIDGVISTARSGWRVDPALLGLLADTVRKAGASVVLSSSWREDSLQKTLPFLPSVLRGLITGQTPSLLSGDRSEEIRHYLMAHPAERYAILDDEDRFPDFQRKHLVLTNPETGLTESNCNDIIHILN